MLAALLYFLHLNQFEFTASALLGSAQMPVSLNGRFQPRNGFSSAGKRLTAATGHWGSSTGAEAGVV